MYALNLASYTPVAVPASFMLASLSDRATSVGVTWGARAAVRLGFERPQPAQEKVEAFDFGPFRMLPGSRTLLRDGRPVDCGSRAFDLLHVLLLSRGKVVSKDAIVRHVWPTTCVEESNLRFQMAALRKVLGTYKGAIKTVPGRGYLLVADLIEEPAVTA